jgi:hypothetical protein
MRKFLYLGRRRSRPGREGRLLYLLGEICRAVRLVALKQLLDGTRSTVVAMHRLARPRACGFSATPSGDLVFILLRALINANVILNHLFESHDDRSSCSSASSGSFYDLRRISALLLPRQRNLQIFNIFQCRTLRQGQFVAHTRQLKFGLRIPNSGNYWPISSTWRPILTYHKVLDTSKALELGQIVVDRDRRKRDISDHARRPRRKLGYCDAGWHPAVVGSRSSLRSEFGCFG